MEGTRGLSIQTDWEFKFEPQLPAFFPQTYCWERPKRKERRLEGREEGREKEGNTKWSQSWDQRPTGLQSQTGRGGHQLQLLPGHVKRKCPVWSGASWLIKMRTSKRESWTYWQTDSSFKMGLWTKFPKLMKKINVKKTAFENQCQMNPL